jgi:hypothetical protein
MTQGREARLKLPKITEALLRKDYSGDDICKILHALRRGANRKSQQGASGAVKKTRI